MMYLTWHVGHNFIYIYIHMYTYHAHYMIFYYMLYVYMYISFLVLFPICPSIRYWQTMLILSTSCLHPFVCLSICMGKTRSQTLLNLQLGSSKELSHEDTMLIGSFWGLPWGKHSCGKPMLNTIYKWPFMAFPHPCYFNRGYTWLNAGHDHPK